MSELRLTRLSEQFREEISTLIMKGIIKDPRVSTFLSINRVDVSADLSYAKVFVSSFMDAKAIAAGVKGLNSAAGFIQSTLGKKLKIRQIPKLTFVFDNSIKDGFEMVKKLDDIAATDKKIAEQNAALGIKASSDTEEA